MEHIDLGRIGMMREHMRECRWCAVFLLAFGSVLFLLGYYLDPGVVRILWLVVTGFMVLMGTFAFILASVFSR